MLFNSYLYILGFLPVLGFWMVPLGLVVLAQEGPGPDQEAHTGNHQHHTGDGPDHVLRRGRVADQRLVRPVAGVRQVFLARPVGDVAGFGEPQAQVEPRLAPEGERPRRRLDLVAGEVRDDGIHLSADRTKTRRARVVTFAESPKLGDLLRAMIPDGAKPDAPVFPSLLWSWDAALRRMVERFGSPSCTAHTLRRTAGTYLTCAPGIFGGASAFMSAKRLGHGVDVAERHYVGHLTLPATAKTLEAALGVEDLCTAIVEEFKR